MRIAALLLLAATTAAADTYPDKPVRLMVGFPPGGAVDVTARALAGPLGERLMQQVVVDNRGGAHGNIAAETVARATPDGHTLLLGTISILAINPALYKNIAFDSLRDFAPITTLVGVSNIVVAHPSLGVNTMNELIGLARAKPGFVTFATSGTGSPGHLAGELLKTLANINMLHVPYKGGGPAMSDLLGGQVNTMFATVSTAVPHIKSGKLRALAVTSGRRAAVLPEVPTIAEATPYRGYEANNWYGMVAPAKTPQRIIDRLNRDLHAVLARSEVRERLLGQGLEAMPSTPAEFSVYLKRELGKWAKVVKDANARVE
ncbi:MAG: tripartite tricarboxylate transporter substrate binding protein [Betaproteobacteria bacterium]